MAKCAVCGKKSLVPERFGETFVCKICFMKVNGPLWKYRTYDRSEDVEKQREKVVKLVREQNFPEQVVIGIDNFFNEQLKGMDYCDVCGESVQTLNTVGSSRLCKKCYSKINKLEWRENEYSDNEQVEINRNRILKIASKQNFPQIVINGINEHFDGKIQKGLVGTVYGECQKLRVFETHCILETYENFDDEEMSKKYAKVLRKNGQGGFISNSAAKALVRGALGGGLVKAGISVATSAVVNVAADKIAPNQTSFRVKKGKFTLNYDYYDIVEFQKVVSIGYEDEIGYMRFRSSKELTGVSNALVFFFINNNSAEKMYSYISDRIEDEKGRNMEQTAERPLKEHILVADEILKLKNLLDMGAITEEEFLTMKKELLSR